MHETSLITEELGVILKFEEATPVVILYHRQKIIHWSDG